MNKIYKVVYSKVKGCWIVVSELAKSNGKAHLSAHIARKTALTTAILLSLGMPFSFAAEADQSINMGTNGVAIGNNAIVTGQNGIAIGTGAVATGDNLDADKIHAILQENEAQLQHINDLRDQIAEEEEQFNEDYAVYQQVQQAQAQIQENTEAIAELTPQQQAAQAAVDNFKPEYDAAVQDMNDRLDMINSIDFTLAGTDEGLDELAAQLKQQTEEGHSFQLDQSWYKQYIQNAIKADADLREANNLEENGWNYIYLSYNQYNGFLGSSNSGIELTGISNYLLNKTILDTVKYSTQNSIGLVKSSGENITSNLSDDNYVIKSPISFDTQQYISTEVYTKEQYDAQLQAIDDSLALWNTFVDGQKNIWAQDETSKQQLRDMYAEKMAIAKLYAEDMYLQGEYERNGKNLEDLQKRKEVDQQIVDAVNAFNEKYGEDFQWQWEINHEQWYEENIGNPVNANTNNKQELTEKFEAELADKQEQMDQLQQTLDSINSQIDQLNKENSQLAPTESQLEQAAAAQASKEKLDADKATLEQALADLSLNDLTDVGENAISMGTNALVTGKNAVGIGTNVLVTGENGVGIGNGTIITGKNSVAVGSENSISGSNSAALGTANTLPGNSSLAVGNSNFVGTDDSIVIGNTSSSSASSAGPNIIIGNGTNITGGKGIAIGNGASINATDTTSANLALGDKASVSGSNAIALGTNSTVAAGESNVVSIGNDSLKRRILHVDAGINDTDAVNKKQMEDSDATTLSSAKSYVDTQLSTVGESIEGVVRYTKDGEGYDTSSIKFAGTDYDATAKTGGTHLTNVAYASGSDMSEAVNVGYMKATTDPMKTQIDTNTSSITTINRDITNIKTDVSNTNTSLTEINNKLDNISSGTADIAGVVKYDKKEEGEGYNTSSIKFAGTDYDATTKTGGTHLTNVAYANSQNLSEAVNVAYLNDATASLQTQINTNTSSITNIDNSISDLSGKVTGNTKDITEINTYLDTLASGSIHITGSIAYDQKDGVFDYGSITLGGGDSNTLTVIHNVGAGIAPTDAVNKQQLDTAIQSAKGEDTHIAAGTYTVKDGSVSMNIVDNTGSTKGNVTISGVASQSELDTVKGSIGSLEYSSVTGTDLSDGDTLTTAVGKVNNKVTKLENTVNNAVTESGKHTTIKEGAGISLTEGENAKGGKEYTVSLNQNEIHLGNDTHNVAIQGTNGTLAATDAISVGKTTLTASGVSVNGAMYVTKDGLNANSQKISNVANGDISRNSKDAVNGSQLFGVQQQVNANSQDIGALSGRINQLDNDIDRVGAGAAALAGLHPGEYDPESKLDFAAGYGHYRGANAAAIGAFYHPNEDTTVSLAGTVGNGDPMISAGVSFKIGEGTTNTLSRTALTQQVKQDREVIQQLVQKVMELEQRLDGQNSTAQNQEQASKDREETK